MPYITTISELAGTSHEYRASITVAHRIQRLGTPIVPRARVEWRPDYFPRGDFVWVSTDRPGPHGPPYASSFRIDAPTIVGMWEDIIAAGLGREYRTVVEAWWESLGTLIRQEPERALGAAGGSAAPLDA